MFGCKPRIFKPQQYKTNKNMCRVETRISLGVCSVSRSGQSLCYPLDESLIPYLPIAISRIFSVNFHGMSPRKLSAKKVFIAYLFTFFFYFSPPKTVFRAKGVPRRNAKKKELFLGLICITYLLTYILLTYLLTYLLPYTFPQSLGGGPNSKRPIVGLQNSIHVTMTWYQTLIRDSHLFLNKVKR